MPKLRRLLRLHADFPAKLRDLPAWPSELQVKGPLPQDGLGVAIIGARAASAAGMGAAHALAVELASLGHRVISGGALGIDAAAHRGALEAGGYTVAVMACGLDQYYPKRNTKLFEAILRCGGALVSPFAEGQLPLPYHFVRRNAVIAALADVVVVVEAGMDSGSLHTARFALRSRRPLAAFSKSPGCESLLASGVPLATCAQDLVDLVEGKPRYPAVTLVPKPGSPESLVLKALGSRHAVTASHLAAQLELPLRQTLRVLQRLEMASLVVLRPGQHYLRSPLADAADLPAAEGDSRSRR